MRLLLSIVAILVVLTLCDAGKKRKKFEGDFEFADDTVGSFVCYSGVAFLFIIFPLW